MNYSNRIALLEDVDAIECLMELSINKLLGPYLSKNQLKASFESMGLDDQLIKDKTYFLIFREKKLVGCGGWSNRATLFGANHTPNRDETFLASVGGGISLAYEIINEGNTILANGAIIQGNSQIIYGGFLGSELQYFLSENLAILGVINTFYYANSDLGSLSGYGGLGVRYYIN